VASPNFQQRRQPQTLRCYESLGLISALRRDNNYREYSPQTLNDPDLSSRHRA
jgi:DNA-binding transcriptional MerR regulator